MKFALAMVTWLDAVSDDDWTHIDNLKLESVLCYSVGFVVGFNDREITLALNHDTKNDNLSCIMTIPLGMVKSIAPLKALIPKGKSNGKSSKFKTGSKSRVNRKNN